MRMLLLVVFLQIGIQLGYSAQHNYNQNESRCFPFDYNFNTEARVFDRLLVIPHMATRSLRDVSNHDIIPENNMRYNEYLSCVWKDRSFQRANGSIDFVAIENALAGAIGRDIGYSGPDGHNTSRRAANRIVGACKNLRGLTDGHKVVLVRNCILNQIKSNPRY